MSIYPLEEFARLQVDASIAPTERDGTITVALRQSPAAESEWPYSSVEQGASDVAPHAAPLVPYHEWAERGPSAMRVWLPVYEG